MSLLEEDFGSESEDDNFNPAPLGNSDSDAAGDSEDKTHMTTKTNGVQHRRRSSEAEIDGEPNKNTKENGLDVDGAGEEDEEEEEDDDGDDEDDEDAISGRPRKRARRDPRNQFLDVEAEVDEEDESDQEDEENETAGFIAETHPDDVEDLPEGAATDDRRHRELDRQRERAQQMDAEKQAQLLREKYGRRTATTADPVTVPKRLLLPSVDDPSIWGVKCKPGKEREIVFAVTKRMEERAGTKNPLPIISALERGKNMTGYVYIEARKQADILTALDGVMNVYPRTQMILIPIREMPELLRVVKSEQLHPGGYVRIKRGKYGGDLAQIDDVESNGLEASLRIVPRLDYGQNEDDAHAPMASGGLKGDAKRKRQGGAGAANPTVRPPPRLFSDVEAKKKHSKFLSSSSTFDKKHWTYMGDDYVNGFLIKDFKIQHLITENVNPTLEEVTRFSAGAEDGTENLDLTALAATLKKSTANESYLPGDTVEVYEGEQQGVWGKAMSVRGDIVTISVTTGELRGQNIEVPIKGLRKRFREGDHVKVIGGSRYQDEVGMVVSIKADQVTLLSDLSMKEITVFSKDLREASDTGVAGGLGRYDIHDLVQLDPATVGCVTKVDRESLRILDQNGSTRSVMPSQISNKIEKRRNAVATDRNGSEIRTDDTVREIGGEQKQGVIVHIYRSFLFLHNREQTENSGISVVRATNVATVAAKGGRVAQGASSGPDLNKMNPALMRNGTNGNAAMPPPKSFGRDRALGQTVTIRKGPYKGLLGIVKDTTDLEARVELHTKGKTISVPKDTLGFKDPLTGQNIDYTRFAGSRGRGDGGRGGLSNIGGATPSRVPEWSSGGRTPLPMAGGRTPAWQAGGSSFRAPAWSASVSTARTPMWRQEASSTNGSRTPAYASANDGSRTVNPYADGSRTVNPYGGSSTTSNRTPAWNPTATSSSFTQDPFASSATTNTTTNPQNPTTATGSRTPAYEPSYRTPAPSYPTPNATTTASRPYDAPTPGKYFTNAPTPAAHPTNGGGTFTGNTPVAMGGAPTPKFSGDAPTPYAGVPETPGFGEGDADADADAEGEDVSPRYETPSP